MSQTLSGQSIAFLVTDGFEQAELTEPKASLEGAGGLVHIVSPGTERVKGWNFDDWGDEFAVDAPLQKAVLEHYDALVLPGGGPHYLLRGFVPETEFHANLEVRNLSVLHMAADLRHLEPLQVSEGLGCRSDGIPDRILDRLLG